MDVMFYEVFKEEEIVLRRYLPPDVDAQFTSKRVQEVEQESPPAKIISIRTQSWIPSEWVGSVSGVLTRSRGYDHLIKFQRQTKGKVVCGFLTNYCARAVAEHAMMAMMVLTKKVKMQIKNFDTFDRDGIVGREFFAHNALIVGVGNVGEEIARMCMALKMRVKGVDIDQKIEDISYTFLEDGVCWADVIFCAVPLTEDTDAMFNYDLLKNAKPGTLFVNISRGEVSPIEVLSELLSEKILGGISLDVYPQEGQLAGFLSGGDFEKSEAMDLILQLKAKHNVLFTPHNAFNTEESLERKAADSVDAIVSFLHNGTFPNTIA